MADQQKVTDFETQWQDKLSLAIKTKTGNDAVGTVMQGGSTLTDTSDSMERLVWTCGALQRLEEFADQETRQKILSECHCVYPVEDLLEIKMVYRVNGNIDQVLDILQGKFEYFLKQVIQLDEKLLETIIERGWGLAGVRDGNTIIATKIPKSSYIEEYFQEEDPQKRSRLYCHCPRVRDLIGTEPSLPNEYCYCGAGFYQGIWEEILGQPVEVEVLESVMQGDDVCKIAIHLPE
jgi:hypothetical protein